MSNHSQESKGTVAFLGTGNMGSAMAGQLIAAGYQVNVYNRTKAKTDALVELGARYCESPRAAAEQAEVIFSMVGNDEASERMWLAEDGALSVGGDGHKLVVECSTLSHDWVLALSKTAQEKGFSYLDCPVTGLPSAAAKGELTLFLGGDRETINKAAPYLDAISTRQLHFGDVGAGTAFKLIVNLMGSIHIAALAEGLLVAEKAGLDMSLVREALCTGGCASPQVINNSKLMVERAFDKDVAFNGTWRLKDTQYGADFARKMERENNLGETALSLFSRLVEEGYGDQSEAKLIDVLR